MRNIEINEIMLIEGSLESKKDGWDFGKWALNVDLSRLSSADFAEIIKAQLKIRINAGIKNGKTRQAIFDRMNTLILASKAKPINILDLIKSSGRETVAYDFGLIQGEIKAERRRKTPDSEIKALLMSDYALTEKQVDDCLNGINPFKTENKAQTVKVARSDNKAGETLSLTENQKKDLREWANMEKGNDADFQWSDESLGNVLEKADIPERLFGIAEFYIKALK